MKKHEFGFGKAGGKMVNVKRGKIMVLKTAWCAKYEKKENQCKG